MARADELKVGDRVHSPVGDGVIDRIEGALFWIDFGPDKRQVAFEAWCLERL